MRSALVLVSLAAGCGRLGFDARASADSGTQDGMQDGTSPTDTPVDSIPGLVARYPMDAAFGAGVFPASNPIHAGSCSPCPTQIAGKVGGAYMFSTTTVVTLPPISSTFVGAAPFTLSIWIEPVAPTTTDAAVVAKPFSPGSSADVVAMFVLQSHQVSFETTPDGSAFSFVNSPASTETVDGRWHHVALTWNGTDKVIWLDGILVGTIPAALATTNQPMILGADIDFGTTLFHYVGGMDDLRIYDHALDAAEIAVLAAG